VAKEDDVVEERLFRLGDSTVEPKRGGDFEGKMEEDVDWGNSKRRKKILSLISRFLPIRVRMIPNG